MRIPTLFVLVLIALPVGSRAETDEPPIPAKPLLQSIADDVNADALRATIAKLVGFGTRHTMSDTQSKTRGIGAARTWVKGRFGEINRDCKGCLQIEMPSQSVTGERIPQPTAIVDVLAIQRGTDVHDTGDPERVIVISGHIDSRVRDVMDAKSDAPGADDDGSGTAAVLEAARVLSKHKFRATLVYAVLSGEEQGLYGGKLLAQYAHDHHWIVEAALNNDIVGNTLGTNGVTDATHVRVYSEGTRSTETAAEATRRRYNGGEVDSPSRNLARFIDGLADTYLKDFSVRMVYRTDRYSRGGDQVPMLAMGYPAVRFTEAIENYTREHQDVRVENGVHYGDVLDAVDFNYLAQVARLNAVTMAALAMAPPPPADVKIEGAVSMDTTVSWSAMPGAASYRVWWRDTTAPLWTNSRPVTDATSVLLKDVNIDDWFFGVSSVSADGYESPVVFPGPAGAFNAVSSAAANAATDKPAYDAALSKRLGADERGMRPYVLVVLKTGPTRMPDGPKRDAMFAGHFANIQRLADAGKLAVAGPFEDNPDHWRGLFVFAVDSIDEARRLTATDPVIVNGEMVAEYHAWYASAALMSVPDIHKTLTPPKKEDAGR